MFLERGVIHHDIIQVYNDEVVDEWLEELIYKSAKGSRCIGEMKRHNKEFERFTHDHTYRLWLIFFNDAHLLVLKPQVKLGEVPSFAKLVEQICAQGN